MKSLARAFFWALLVGAPGCALVTRPAPSPHPDLIAARTDPSPLPGPRRVVVLPLECEDGTENDARILGAALRAAIAERSLFEAVPVNAEDVKDLSIGLTRERGFFRTKDLIEIGRRFGVDGLLYGVITQIRHYPCMSIGLRLVLIDVRVGEVPFATDFLLDGSDRRVVEDLANWQVVTRQDTESLWGPERGLQGPHLYSSYVADRVARRLERALQPAAAVQPADTPAR